MVCAEDNTGYLSYDVVPLPHADKADFRAAGAASNA
jgi:hypothetical protein